MTECPLFRPHLRKQIAQTELCLPGSTANRAAAAPALTLTRAAGRHQSPAVSGLHCSGPIQPGGPPGFAKVVMLKAG